MANLGDGGEPKKVWVCPCARYTGHVRQRQRSSMRRMSELQVLGTGCFNSTVVSISYYKPACLYDVPPVMLREIWRPRHPASVNPPHMYLAGTGRMSSIHILNFLSFFLKKQLSRSQSFPLFKNGQISLLKRIALNCLELETQRPWFRNYEAGQVPSGPA